MLASGPIRPCDRDLDLLSESGRRDLAGNPTDRLGRDTADRRDGLRRIARIEIALGDELKYRHGAAPVGQLRFANDARFAAGFEPARQPARAVEHERFAGLVAREEAVIGAAGRLDDEPSGVGVAAEIVEIDLVGP